MALRPWGIDPLFEELVLHDIDAGRLAVVGGFAERILRSSGSSARLTLTTDLEAAVDGATAVLLQLRVGGQAARASDESFPLACDCLGQETTGAGGLAKALRTVPVVRGIAEVVRERALPDAWIVDFTNPVGIVTRALLEDGHRAVGLCNVAIGFQRMFAAMAGLRAGARGAGPRRAEPPDVDPVRDGRRPGADAADPGRARRRARREPGDAAGARRGGRGDPVVLPALLLPARRGGPGAAGLAGPGPPRSWRSRPSCWRCTPTRR